MSEYDIDLALHSASDGSQFDMFLPRIFDAAGDAADPATLCRCPQRASPAPMQPLPLRNPFRTTHLFSHPPTEQLSYDRHDQMPIHAGPTPTLEVVPAQLLLHLAKACLHLPTRKGNPK